MSQTPTSTDHPQSTWTHTTYGSATAPQVDAYSIAGAGHVLPQAGMAAIAVHFFGLDSGGGNPSPSPTSSVPTSPSPTPSTSPSRPPPTSPSGTGPSGACRVTDAVNAWNTGLTENITITDTGAVSGWKLVFTLAPGQTITSGWNATYAPSTGTVTAANLSYNGAIPPGGSTSIGFQATHTGNTSAPASFTLNGTMCTIG